MCVGNTQAKINLKTIQIDTNKAFADISMYVCIYSMWWLSKFCEYVSTEIPNLFNGLIKSNNSNKNISKSKPTFYFESCYENLIVNEQVKNINYVIIIMLCLATCILINSVICNIIRMHTFQF